MVHSLSGFMQEVTDASHVLLVVDENYVERADNAPTSGVGIETEWISSVFESKPNTWLSVLFVKNPNYCSGQLILATLLEFNQNNRSDSLGVSPPLY